MHDAHSITQDFLHDLFDYKDGQLFWKIKKRRIQPGTRAGCTKKEGYRFVTINGVNHYEHRLIYAWHFGSFTQEIDHIDGNGLNNKIENLRIATSLENSRNKKTFSTNTSGRKGISYDKQANKWRAYIGISGKVKVLGFSKNFEEAVKLRENAEKEIFGEFNRVSG